MRGKTAAMCTESKVFHEKNARSVVGCPPDLSLLVAIIADPEKVVEDQMKDHRRDGLACVGRVVGVQVWRPPSCSRTMRDIAVSNTRKILAIWKCRSAAFDWGDRANDIRNIRKGRVDWRLGGSTP